jgi:DNA (cytosine-5)-methyltransferase 1
VETEGGIMEIRPGCNAHYKLRDQIDMLPTPKGTASGPDYARMNREGSGGDDLVTAMARMIPTPATRDYKGANSREHAETAKGRAHMDQLPNALAHGTNRGLKLQPAFVEWMMGYPEGWTELTD